MRPTGCSMLRRVGRSAMATPDCARRSRGPDHTTLPREFTCGASLYEAFPPAEARRLLDKIEFHYTPKHGSWVTMPETEIGIMNRQCLDRRLHSQETIATEVAVWEDQRNAQGVRIHWTFTRAIAPQKLRNLY